MRKIFETDRSISVGSKNELAYFGSSLSHVLAFPALGSIALFLVADLTQVVAV